MLVEDKSICIQTGKCLMQKSKNFNKYVTIGNNTKIWNFCNIYGTKKEPVYIGDNTQIGSYVEIKPGVKIGRYCRIQAFVFIPERTVIGDYVFIGPRVTFTNEKYPTSKKAITKTSTIKPCQISSHVTIGAGAVIGPGIKIGKYAFIGMGAVVVKDVKDYQIVVGNPARTVGEVTDKKYENQIC